jgi:L-amino acid N-acyltransferase YncA
MAVVVIRDAGQDDLPAITEVANALIATTAIEWTDERRFHERLGFVEIARLPEVGHKFGRWLDLVLLQLVLDDAQAPPSH